MGDATTVSVTWSGAFSSVSTAAGASLADMRMYNTLMAVAAGVGLLLIVAFVTKLHRWEPILHEGWAVTFGALGAILAFLGGVMTVTWPLPRLASNCCTHDNIVFGEPTFAFGAMLLAAVPRSRA